VEAIPHPLTCRPVRSIPSRFVHRVIASVPHNPPQIRRRHQKEPAKSHRWCRPGTPSGLEPIDWRGKDGCHWAALGSQPGCSALPCCLARFVITCRTPRAAQHRKSALQPAKEPPYPPLPLCSHQRVQQNPGYCLLACSLRWVFVGVSIVVTVCCSRRITTMTLTCMQACINITRVCTSFMSKSVIVPCFCQNGIAKAMQACNFYNVACPRLEPARG
jgi:hypothetical protein